jgi:hypothetical protein
MNNMIQMSGPVAGIGSWLHRYGALIANIGPAVLITIMALALLATLLIVFRATSKGYDLDIRCRTFFGFQLTLRSKKDG